MAVDMADMTDMAVVDGLTGDLADGTMAAMTEVTASPNPFIQHIDGKTTFKIENMYDKLQIHSPFLNVLS
jgi:hypothetical protein